MAIWKQSKSFKPGAMPPVPDFGAGLQGTGAAGGAAAGGGGGGGAHHSMHTSTIAHQKSMGKAEHDRQEASGHKADDAAAAAAPHNPGATDLRGGGDAAKHSSRDTVNAMKERQHAKVVSAAAAGGGGGVSEKQHTTTTTTAPDKHKETVREHEKEQDQWVGHGKVRANGNACSEQPSSFRLNLKMILLPRQARDKKHEETLTKRGGGGDLFRRATRCLT
jgi:hypothetical protein